MYLLCESWLSTPRATLPDDDEELALLCNLKKDDFLHIKSELISLFKIGKCKEHKGFLYNETLLEISRKSENKQRLGNKNAKRTRKKRKRNAAPEYEIETEIGIKEPSKRRGNKPKFMPPSLEEVRAYCKEKGYSGIADKVHDYYEKLDWHDSMGKRVLSWKSKLIANWFKPENKDKEDMWERLRKKIEAEEGKNDA